MPISKITKSAVIRQAQKPSNPEPGLIWYDTSADVLKQYKNGKFKSVSRAVDGSTLIKNQEGELEVNNGTSLEMRNGKFEVIREFQNFAENYDSDDLSNFYNIDTSGSSSYFQIDSSDSYDGASQSAHLRISGENNPTDSVTLDVSAGDATNLLIAVKANPYDSDDPLQVIVGGEVVYDTTSSSYGSWREISVDISDKTGPIDVEFKGETGYTGDEYDADFWIQFVRARTVIY